MPAEALVPSATGILNVETLAGLGQAGRAIRSIFRQAAHRVAMPRPVVAALAADLRMTMKETPVAVLRAHRPSRFSRLSQPHDPQISAAIWSEAQGGGLKELFLRGKVDYLFQRYTAEQELTSMLLCLRPSNLDVTTLPAVIEEWIGATHGATPEARRGRPQLLFFVLTMFDQHLAEKAGDEGVDPGLRFQARLEASLHQALRQGGDRMADPMDSGSAVPELFLDSQSKLQGLGRHSIRGVPRNRRCAATSRAHRRSCVKLTPVCRKSSRHFRDPMRAFDEVMRLNDGGVSYLAGALEEVCKPGMKQAQARNRMNDLKKRMREVLVPHYVPTDSEQRVAERTAIAEGVIADFEECVARQAFGAFLRGLCVDRGELVDAFYEARLSGALIDAKAEVVAPAEMRPVAPTRRGGLLDLVKSNGARPLAPVGGPLTTGARARTNRNDGFARAALQLWSKSVHETCEDPAFADAIGPPRHALREVATELIATARRRGSKRKSNWR